VTTPRNILVFMGTPPRAIKLAPVVAALHGASDFRCTVVATGQHKEMFRQVAETFGFAVDADLDVMRPNQTLAGLTARLWTAIDGWLASAQPDMALVQGDTTTVLVAALAWFLPAHPHRSRRGRAAHRQHLVAFPRGRLTAGWPLRWWRSTSHPPRWPGRPSSRGRPGADHLSDGEHRHRRPAH